MIRFINFSINKQTKYPYKGAEIFHYKWKLVILSSAHRFMNGYSIWSHRAVVREMVMCCITIVQVKLRFRERNSYLLACVCLFIKSCLYFVVRRDNIYSPCLKRNLCMVRNRIRKNVQKLAMSSIEWQQQPQQQKQQLNNDKYSFRSS